MAEIATTTQQGAEQLIQQAITLLTENLATIYGQGEPLENVVRLLARSRMLTNNEQRDAEIARDRSLNRVLNHVPVGQFKAEVRRADEYIGALERATSVLLAQLDAVTELAPVKKTVTGRRAAEQADRARTFVEQAGNRHRDSETRRSDYV